MNASKFKGFVKLLANFCKSIILARVGEGLYIQINNLSLVLTPEIKQKLIDLLFNLELVLVDASTHHTDPYKVDFSLGEAIKLVKKIQELGGLKTYEFKRRRTRRN